MIETIVALHLFEHSARLSQQKNPCVKYLIELNLNRINTISILAFGMAVFGVWMEVATCMRGLVCPYSQ